MTNLNPLDLLDNVLSEYASPGARRAIHAALMLVAALVTLYMAYEKDWMQALLALAATLYTGANKANTDPLVEEPPEDALLPEEEEDDPLAMFESLASGPVEFGDEDYHGDEADYDFGIVLADAKPPTHNETSALPIEAPHGGGE